MYIDEAIMHILDNDTSIESQKDLCTKLGISAPMVSAYKKRESRPNLHNASRIWGLYGIQVEPYTELSLQEEWEYQLSKS